MKNVICSTIFALALVGCGADQVETSSAPGPDQGPVEVPSVASTSLGPMPDTRPLSAYTEVNSGKQLGYQYHAAQSGPVDFAELARTTWHEFDRERDQFARIDMLERAKPEMERELSQARANPYHWMLIGESTVLLDAYDFDRKGFPVKEFTQVGQRHYNDTSHYAIRWVNADQLGFAPVPDQEAARQIEALRSGKVVHRSGVGRAMPLLKVYYFVQSTTPRQGQFDALIVNAWVVRVQITDHHGSVLAEYTPDGNVPITQPASDECQGNAADCAVQALGL